MKHILTKITAWVMTLSMILGMLVMVPVTASATSPTQDPAPKGAVNVLPDNWEKKQNYDHVLEGEGSALSPYLIQTAEDFVYFQDRIASAASADTHFKLTNSVDLRGQAFWTPTTQVFAGVLDGDGHSVLGMDFSSGTGIHLLYTVTGTIKNISLSAYYDGNQAVGFFHDINGGTLENVHFYADFYSGRIFGVAISLSNGALLSGVTVSGNIVSDTAPTNAEPAISAFSSTSSNCTLRDCVNYATLTSAMKIGTTNGGWIQTESGGTVLDGCVNYGNISVPTYTSSSNTQAGAFIGSASATASFANCVNYGNLASGATYAGGFVGLGASKANYTFENCANYGSVSGTRMTGGFIGRLDGASVTFNGCFNYGAISHTVAGTNNGAGGFVGWTQGTTTLNDCGSYGSLSGLTAAGGIIGSAQAALSMTNCVIVTDIGGTTSNKNAVFGAKANSLPSITRMDHVLVTGSHITIGANQDNHLPALSDGATRHIVSDITDIADDMIAQLNSSATKASPWFLYKGQVQPITNIGFTGATMTLGSTMALNVKLDSSVVSGLENATVAFVNAQSNSATATPTLDEQGRFSVSYEDLRAAELAKDLRLYIAVTVNGTTYASTNILTYSPAQYLMNLKTKYADDANVVDVAEKMLNYGAEAEAKATGVAFASTAVAAKAGIEQMAFSAESYTIDGVMTEDDKAVVNAHVPGGVGATLTGGITLSLNGMTPGDTVKVAVREAFHTYTADEDGIILVDMLYADMILDVVTLTFSDGATARVSIGNFLEARRTGDEANLAGATIMYMLSVRTYVWGDQPPVVTPPEEEEERPTFAHGYDVGYGGISDLLADEIYGEKEEAPAEKEISYDGVADSIVWNFVSQKDVDKHITNANDYQVAYNAQNNAMKIVPKANGTAASIGLTPINDSGEAAEALRSDFVNVMKTGTYRYLVITYKNESTSNEISHSYINTAWATSANVVSMKSEAACNDEWQRVVVAAPADSLYGLIFRTGTVQYTSNLSFSPMTGSVTTADAVYWKSVAFFKTEEAANAYAAEEVRDIVVGTGTVSRVDMPFMAGYSDYTFRPDNALTRAEALAMVVSLGADENTAKAVFGDASMSAAITNAELTALLAHIDTVADAGVPNNANTITRAQAAKAICTALGRTPTAASMTGLNIVGFADVTSAHAAYPYIIEATLEHGVSFNEDGSEQWLYTNETRVFITETTEEYVASLDAAFDARVEEVRATESEWTLSNGGKIFYVSSTSGSDSNSGTDSNAPLKTIARVHALQNNGTINAGDVVLLKRGDEWYEKLRCKAGVTYSAYGTGAKPALLGSIKADNASQWVATDVTNVYKFNAAVTSSQDVGTIIFNDGEAYGVRVLVQDGYTVAIGDNGLVSNGLTEWTFPVQAFTGYADLKHHLMYWHDWSTNSLYLYCEGGNPGNLFDAIDISTKGNVIDAKSDVTLDNLCIKYGSSHGVGVYAPLGTSVSNLTIRNCEVGWIGGALQHEDGRLIRLGNAIEIFGSAEHYNIYNNYIYECFDCGPTVQFTGTIPDGTAVVEIDVNIYDNVIERCNSPLEVWLTSYAEPTEQAFALLKDCHVYNNLCRDSGYGFGGYIHQKSDYNMFYGGEATKAVYDNCVIENNVMWNARKYLQKAVPTSVKSGQGFVWRNNTIIMELDGPLALLGSDSVASTGSYTEYTYNNATIAYLISVGCYGFNNFLYVSPTDEIKYDGVADSITWNFDSAEAVSGYTTNTNNYNVTYDETMGAMKFVPKADGTAGDQGFTPMSGNSEEATQLREDFVNIMKSGVYGYMVITYLNESSASTMTHKYLDKSYVASTNTVALKTQEACNGEWQRVVIAVTADSLYGLIFRPGTGDYTSNLCFIPMDGAVTTDDMMYWKSITFFKTAEAANAYAAEVL